MIFHNDKILTPKMPVGPPEQRRRSMKKHSGQVYEPLWLLARTATVRNSN